MKTLDLIIPALNEEEGIGEVIDKFPREEMGESGFDVGIIVVDGGSSDRTQDIARQKGATVVVEERPGYGRAYKTGFAESDADVIVTSDADTTYSLDRVPEIVETLEDGFDFISTNRLSRMVKGSMGWRNRLGNETLNMFSWLLFGVPYRDSQSGMWVFRRKILDDLVLRSDGMPFSEEIKIEAYKRGFNVREFDIQYFRRKGEKELHAWSDGLENLLFLFKKKLSYLRE